MAGKRQPKRGWPAVPEPLCLEGGLGQDGVPDDQEARPAAETAALAIERLTAELAERDAALRAQAAELAHRSKIFERAAEAARIGVWECCLDTEELTWTDGVYEMFDLPPGIPPERSATLQCYTPASAALMQSLRARAIAEHGSFTLDVEIVTPKGRQRWIRITATVESEAGVPVRIFGMKQDITEEKLLSDRTRYLAAFDVMTGLANRAQFQERLEAGAAEGAAPIAALILIDLDGFKTINDTHGHALGDECLKEAAGRLAAVCHSAELVARIGGDEFAVLLSGGFDRSASQSLAADIVAVLGRPVLSAQRMLPLGASVGIAHFDGCRANELFVRADVALYAAKAAGRNTFRLFQPAMMPEPLRAG